MHYDYSRADRVGEPARPGGFGGRFTLGTGDDPRCRTVRDRPPAVRAAFPSVVLPGSVSVAEALGIDRETVSSLMAPLEYVPVVEEAFRAHARGRCLAPGALHADAPEGEFHVKTGGFLEPEPRFAVKANAGFFANERLRGLPNIQGVILLFDASDGRLLALLDSVEITIRRTAAATAAAARALARRDASSIAVLGCGTQARAHLEMLCDLLPIERGFAWSRDPERAERFARAMTERLARPVEAVRDPADAVAASHVCVTCTPSREPILASGWVRPGSFVAAVGADSPEKQEVEPALLARSRVVVDLLEQCAAVGELHHALAAGAMDRKAVHGTLGEVLIGRVPGRTDPDEIFLFDSTGTALQDAAAAEAVYRRAVRSSGGMAGGTAGGTRRPG